MKFLLTSALLIILFSCGNSVSENPNSKNDSVTNKADSVAKPILTGTVHCFESEDSLYDSLAQSVQYTTTTFRIDLRDPKHVGGDIFYRGYSHFISEWKITSGEIADDGSVHFVMDQLEDGDLTGKTSKMQIEIHDGIMEMVSGENFFDVGTEWPEVKCN